MLNSFLKDKILEEFSFKPTNNQNLLLTKLSDFIFSENENELFLLKGYAGTGKTTVISALVKSLKKLKQKTFLLAPTGRAAKVLSSYSKTPAYTIHKKIYRQKTATDNMGSFALDRNFHKDTLFIVDEASMIAGNTYSNSIFGSGDLLSDLIEYVYNGNNCKLILIGDTAQLPPVGLDLSPALDKEYIEKNFYRNVIQVVLTEVVRQTQESGILYNATNLRDLIKNEESIFPKFQLKNYTDIQRVSGADLIEEISSSYYNFGQEDTIIVTRSNNRANKFNQGIRNSILYREEELSQGDYLMVVKNNYFWLDKNEDVDFIANGDIVEIVKIKKYYELYNRRFAEVTVRFLDYKDLEIDTKIMLDTLSIDTPALTADENREFYYKIAEDYPEIRNKRKLFEKIRENEFFNALQVKFAYCVTCHKAQGGQWKSVFVDIGYLTDEMLGKEFYRWLYTAVTRSTEKLYLVNFKDEFFE